MALGIEFIVRQKERILDRLQQLSDQPDSAGMHRPHTQQEKTLLKFALSRIEENQYGLCTNCGFTIEREFLEVTPETPFCLDCTKAIRND